MTTHVFSFSSSAAGIGFFGALQIVSLALKLTGAIQWPWWVAMSPLLFQAALFGVVILAMVALFIVALISK